MRNFICKNLSVRVKEDTNSLSFIEDVKEHIQKLKSGVLRPIIRFCSYWILFQLLKEIVSTMNEDVNVIFFIIMCIAAILSLVFNFFMFIVSLLLAFAIGTITGFYLIIYSLFKLIKRSLI